MKYLVGERIAKAIHEEFNSNMNGKLNAIIVTFAVASMMLNAVIKFVEAIGL
jgi:hypothetical protein